MAMYAAILAGGSGTRLWPLSTTDHPKQFLRLVGDRTMLQATVDRIAPLVASDQTYVITSGDYTPLVLEQLPDLPPGNVVAEPVGRGTAASIGLAATLIAARDPHAVMVSLASDHLVADAQGFQAALRFGADLAAQGKLVTLGITPTYPETGFGYIQFGAALERRDELTAHTGDAFKEKPVRAEAERYLASGNYVWNASIFMWRVDRILEEIARHVPEVSAVLRAIAAAVGPDGQMTPSVERAMREAWPRLTASVTIDVGVMEKVSDLAVIPIDVGWNDIGGWAQVADLHPADDSGNVVVGLTPADYVHRDSSDTLVYSTTGRVIATVGVADLIIVDTEDAVLIVPRRDAQRVRELVEEMKRRRELPATAGDA